MDKNKILLVGSGSILSAELVLRWKDLYQLTVAYSGSSPGAIVASLGANAKPLQDVLSSIEAFDVIVIVSAYVPLGKVDEGLLYEVNVKLTETLLARFASSRIIYCSSISVYEPQDDSVITETTLLLPQSTYAISKLWAEKLVLQASARHAVIRISSLAGKHMKDGTFLPRVIRQARETGEIVLFGNGMRLQNYIHVADLARMIDGIVQNSAAGTFLGVNTRSYSNLEVAEAVQGEIPGTLIRFSGEDNSRGYTFDASHSYDASGHKPTYDLNTIIKELLA